MPTPDPQAVDTTGKRRRRESDVDGPTQDTSDPDAPPTDAPTQQAGRVTRARAREGKKKRAEGKKTAAAKSNAARGKDDDDLTDDTEKTDAATETSGPTTQVASSASTRRVARLEEKYGDLSTQDALDARAAKWTSQVYNHFQKPVLVTKKDGSITTRFVCIAHPSKHVDRTPSDESTGNLNRHVQACKPMVTPETQLITQYAQGATYSYARVRFLLAMWIARRHRPFTIVEDPEFRELVRMLYARAELPSRVTVSRDLKDIFEDSRARVKVKLTSLPGKIHICLDGWTSPNVISFLGVTAHWHENGKIEHIILDFIKLTKGHTGKYLALKLMELLREFEIVPKVLAVTCDNASNNETMLKELTKLDKDFRGPDARVRCFGHVINLVVKAILSRFGQKGKLDVGESDKDLSALADPEDDDEEEDEVDEAREAADEQEIDKDNEARPDLQVTDAEYKAGRLALQKIIKLSAKVWNSPTIRAEMARQAQDAGKNSEVLIRAVRTRWNTITMVLQRALELRSILFNVCDKAEFNKSQGVRLRRFILEDDEWEIIQQLYDLLATFLEATVAISHSSTPLVHEVIPWIDVMVKHLEETRDSISKLPIVRAGADKGLKILQKYYKHIDDTPFYRVAMLLHPCYKKRYFARARWPRSWIEESLRLLRLEWNQRYRNTTQRGQEGDVRGPFQNAGSSGEGGTSARTQSQTHSSAASRAARDMLASITGADELEPEDALEGYLEAPVRTTQTDPLKFWNNGLQNGTTDAALAQMALDVLSIPATSMDAERAFSRGRLTVSRLRHSLSDQTVRASTVLGSWARYTELVPEADAVELLRKKEKGKGNVPPTQSDSASSQPANVITLDSDSE